MPITAAKIDKGTLQDKCRRTELSSATNWGVTTTLRGNKTTKTFVDEDEENNKQIIHAIYILNTHVALKRSIIIFNLHKTLVFEFVLR